MMNINCRLKLSITIIVMGIGPPTFRKEDYEVFLQRGTNSFYSYINSLSVFLKQKKTNYFHPKLTIKVYFEIFLKI